MRGSWMRGRIGSGSISLAMVRRGVLGLLAASAMGPLAAADWPQWRGPQRNGISAETGWQRWPATGPKRLWAAQVGEGFSAVAVKGGRVYTMGNADRKSTRLNSSHLVISYAV